MSRFRGRYFHSMDSKGRISLPPRFREILQELKERKLVVTNYQQRLRNAPGNIRYLMAFPMQEWREVEVKLEAQSLFQEDLRDFQRLLSNRSEDCPLDRQGRILISSNLRDYAKLSREVCLVGALRCIEIWDRESYEAHMKQSEESNYEEMVQRLNL